MGRRSLLVLLLCANACVAPRPDVVVFAAASLTEVLTAIGDDQALRIAFSFGPSSGLATQIAEGAPADVVFTASPAVMDRIEAERGLLDRIAVARNRLVVIASAGSPVRSPAHLARPGVRIVLAAEGVPAGDYARAALERLGTLDAVARNVVSNEIDVKGVVQKVLLGEADAGIAYATDARAAGLDAIPLGGDDVLVELGLLDPGRAARTFAERFREEHRSRFVAAGFSPP